MKVVHKVVHKGDGDGEAPFSAALRDPEKFDPGRRQ